MTDRRGDPNLFRGDFNAPGGGSQGSLIPLGQGTVDTLARETEQGLPVTALSSDQSNYNFNYRVFPNDLTMDDNNHYMVININVPVGYDKVPRSSFTGAENRTTPVSGDGFSRVDTLRFGQLPDPGQGSTQSYGFSLINRRYTKRIAESIALHMPQSGLVYTEDNKYQEISMTALGGSAISAIVGGIAGTMGETAAKTTGQFLDAAGNILKTGGQVLGMPINPAVEVLFATRPQRQWMFEVFMMPRSKKEADTVKEIIKTLRFHAAPELDKSGFTFIPPAEFDITFYRGGTENTNLPRINTCALQRIDIDYAPQQDYAVFEDGGYPVAVRMSLGFIELEVLHKRRIVEGF